MLNHEQNLLCMQHGWTKSLPCHCCQVKTSIKRKWALYSFLFLPKLCILLYCGTATIMCAALTPTTCCITHIAWGSVANDVTTFTCPDHLCALMTDFPFRIRNMQVNNKIQHKDASAAKLNTLTDNKDDNQIIYNRCENITPDLKAKFWPKYISLRSQDTCTQSYTRTLLSGNWTHYNWGIFLRDTPVDRLFFNIIGHDRLIRFNRFCIKCTSLQVVQQKQILWHYIKKKSNG